MIAKIWKKILFIILIVACLFNIVYKFVKKVPLIQQLKDSVVYTITKEQKQNINSKN